MCLRSQSFRRAQEAAKWARKLRALGSKRHHFGIEKELFLNRKGAAF
jgi:hypothetical protein